MEIREVVSSFSGAVPLAGLEDAWYWCPAPGIDFAGALSADRERLLQLRATDTFDQALAVAVLEFARQHEQEMFDRNSYLGAAEGFESPAGYQFDVIAGAAPEVHRFYSYEKPELTPLVRLVFPAYS